MGRFQKGPAAVEAHGHRGRKLVAWRREDQFRPGQPAVDHQPVAVQRDRPHPFRPQPQDVAHVRIARILHRHRGRRRHEQAGQEIQRVLRPQGHQDFVIARRDAAPGQDAPADLLDQHRVVFGEPVLGPGVQPPGPHGLAHAVAPFGDREQLGVHLAVDERIAEPAPVDRLADVVLPGRPDPEPAVPIDRPRRAGGRNRRQVEMGRGRILGDIEAAALPRRQEAVGNQGLIGQRHGVARDLQAPRHGPGRRHRGTGRQLPGQHRRNQGLADLRLQGRRLGAFEMEQRVAHGPPGPLPCCRPGWPYRSA